MEPVAPFTEADLIAIVAGKVSIAAGIPVGLGAVVALFDVPLWRLSSTGLVYGVTLAGGVVLIGGGVALSRALRYQGRAADGLLWGLAGGLMLGAAVAASLWWSPRMWSDTPFAFAVLLGAAALPSLASAVALLFGGSQVWTRAPRHSHGGPASGIVRSGARVGVVVWLLSCCGTIGIPRPFA